MRLRRSLAFAALLPFAVPAAFAGDAPLPNLVVPQPPALHGLSGGWYLRGDIGYSLPAEERLQAMRTLVNTVEDYSTTRLGKQGTLGVGIGYHITPWLRVDATFDQRAKSAVSGAYSAIGDPAIAREDTRAKFAAMAGLVNIYADLGNWAGFTPYIGAGIGVAQLKLSDYAGTTTITPAAPAWGTGLCPAVPAGQTETCASPSTPGVGKKTGLAWALMTGASLDLSTHLKVDVGYRFMNYGPVEMRPDPFGIAVRLKDVKAHEVRVGLRYVFGAGPMIPEVVTAKY